VSATAFREVKDSTFNRLHRNCLPINIDVVFCSRLTVTACKDVEGMVRLLGEKNLGLSEMISTKVLQERTR
jgi:hypothetical protein